MLNQIFTTEGNQQTSKFYVIFWTKICHFYVMENGKICHENIKICQIFKGKKHQLVVLGHFFYQFFVNLVSKKHLFKITAGNISFRKNTLLHHKRHWFCRPVFDSNKISVNILMLSYWTQLSWRLEHKIWVCWRFEQNMWYVEVGDMYSSSTSLTTNWTSPYKYNWALFTFF